MSRFLFIFVNLIPTSVMKSGFRFLIAAALLSLLLAGCDSKSSLTPVQLGASSITDVIGTIESIVVVPYYKDGSVRMSEGAKNDIRFEIYPLEATESLANAGPSVFSLDYVTTLTKAVEAPEEIPITSVSFDGKFLVVTADGSIFPEEITIGPIGANARLRISDGTATRSSEYFPLGFVMKRDLSCEIEAVDLGLSVLWGDRNLGADSPEDFGDYYAWGELMPYYLEISQEWTAYGHLFFTWRENKSGGYFFYSYRWYNPETGRMMKYNLEDKLVELQRGERPGEEVDDVARAVLGGKWRLPTPEECRELDRYAGYLSEDVHYFYSPKTQKSIVVPHAGSLYQYDYRNGDKTLLWTSSAGGSFNDAQAAEIGDMNSIHIKDHIERWSGLPIRPVCDY